MAVRVFVSDTFNVRVNSTRYKGSYEVQICLITRSKFLFVHTNYVTNYGI